MITWHPNYEVVEEIGLMRMKPCVHSFQNACVLHLTLETIKDETMHIVMNLINELNRVCLM
jgi:hypothetical protein